MLGSVMLGRQPPRLPAHWKISGTTLPAPFVPSNGGGRIPSKDRTLNNAITATFSAVEAGRTTELSDAGGPACRNWQLRRPARIRSSNFVRPVRRSALGGGRRVCRLAAGESLARFPPKNVGVISSVESLGSGCKIFYRISRDDKRRLRKQLVSHKSKLGTRRRNVADKT